MEEKTPTERSRLAARKCYKICPMCKGKGYFDENVTAGPTPRPKPQGQNEGGDTDRQVASLPKIKCPRKKNSRPNTPRILQDKAPVQKAAASNPLLPDRILRKGTQERRQRPNSKMSKLPSITKMKSYGSETSVNTDMSDFLNEEKDLGDVKETVRLAKLKLKNNDWDTVMSGLEEIARASLLDNDLIDWETTGLAMTRLVDAFAAQKTRTIRLACQILRELFKNMTNVHRPQFDDIVNELMKKTADTSRMVRWDADQALDSLVSHVPIQYATRAILSQAPKHKNPTIRYTAVRLVENIVVMMSPEVIFTHQALKDCRRLILNSLCILIDDQNQDVRWTVRRILQILMKNENFEEYLNSDVEPQILKKADRSLVVLQYEKDAGT